MFDVLRNHYELRCPATGATAGVSLSRFRSVRRLRGAEHPAVFRVVFDCDACSGRHESLISHDRLDWEPLGIDIPTAFTDLVSGSRALLGSELAGSASARLKQGGWPWTFFCHPESAIRPGFPSSLRLVAPTEGTDAERIGVTVRCFHCQRLTVNIVSRSHLDVPWYSDPHIAYLGVLLRDDQITTEERFRHQLASNLQHIGWADIADAS